MSNCLFYPTNGQKHKDIYFTIIYSKEKHLIVMFDKLVAENIWHLCLEKRDILDYFLS